MLNVAFDEPDTRPNATRAPAAAGESLEMQSFEYSGVEAGNMNTPVGLPAGSKRAFGNGYGDVDDEYANDLPLLQELGIDFQEIRGKAMVVLHPFKQDSDKLSRILEKYDLAGPIVIALMLGTCLMLGGKMHFGYIYGVGSVGCCGLYVLLNLMHEQGVDIYRIASVLGYCLLPMVFVAALAPLLALRSWLGVTITALCVLWCTHSAASMFTAALGMKEQRWLILYPIGLYFATFAILTVF